MEKRRNYYINYYILQPVANPKMEENKLAMMVQAKGVAGKIKKKAKDKKMTRQEKEIAAKEEMKRLEMLEKASTATGGKGKKVKNPLKKGGRGGKGKGKGKGKGVKARSKKGKTEQKETKENGKDKAKPEEVKKDNEEEKIEKDVQVKEIPSLADKAPSTNTTKPVAAVKVEAGVSASTPKPPSPTPPSTASAISTPTSTTTAQPTTSTSTTAKTTASTMTTTATADATSATSTTPSMNNTNDTMKAGKVEGSAPVQNLITAPAPPETEDTTTQKMDSLSADLSNQADSVQAAIEEAKAQAEEMKRRMEAMAIMREKSEQARQQRIDEREKAKKLREDKEREQTSKIVATHQQQLEIAASKEKRAQKSRLRTHKIQSKGNSKVPPPPKGGIRKKTSMARIARDVLSGIKMKRRNSKLALQKGVPVPPPPSAAKRSNQTGKGGPPPPPPSSSSSPSKVPPPAPKGPPPPSPRTKGIIGMQSVKTLDELQNMVKEGKFGLLKSGALEMNLSEREFKDTFGIARSEFISWPSWKKQAARKEHGLL